MKPAGVSDWPPDVRQLWACAQRCGVWNALDERFQDVANGPGRWAQAMVMLKLVAKRLGDKAASITRGSVAARKERLFARCGAKPNTYAYTLLRRKASFPLALGLPLPASSLARCSFKGRWQFHQMWPKS